MDLSLFRSILGGRGEEVMDFQQQEQQQRPHQQQRQEQQQQRPQPQQEQLHQILMMGVGGGGGAAAVAPVMPYYNYDEDIEGIIGGGTTITSSGTIGGGGGGGPLGRSGGRRRKRTTSTTTSLKYDVIQPPSSLSGIHPTLIACKIWCHPNDEHRQQEIFNLPLEEREKVWADLSGNPYLSHYNVHNSQGSPPPGLEAASSVDSSRSSSDGSVGINNSVGRGGAAATTTSKHDNNIKKHVTNSDVPLEDAAFIEVCLERMEYEIECNISNKDKEAYLIAYNQDPYYVENRNFRVMFLRSDQYDIQASCRRLVDHFTMKRYLFGIDKLTKDIKQDDDLTQDDIDCLKTGGYQYLDGITDHAGRSVVFTRLAYMKYKSSINFVRAAWYQTMSFVTNNHRVQRLGVVCIPYLLDGFGSSSNDNASGGGGGGGIDYEFIRLAMKAARVWPIRFVAQYNLYQNPAWDHVLDLVAFILGPLVRVRTRNIRGTYQECIYQLMCLGISQGSLPVLEDDGSMDTYKFHQWLNKVRQKEQLEKQRQQLEQQKHLDWQEGAVDMEE